MNADYLKALAHQVMDKPYIICPRKNGYTEAMRISNLMKSILDSGKEK